MLHNKLSWAACPVVLLSPQKSPTTCILSHEDTFTCFLTSQALTGNHKSKRWPHRWLLLTGLWTCPAHPHIQDRPRFCTILPGVTSHFPPSTFSRMCLLGPPGMIVGLVTAKYKELCPCLRGAYVQTQNQVYRTRTKTERHIYIKEDLKYQRLKVSTV